MNPCYLTVEAWCPCLLNEDSDACLTGMLRHLNEMCWGHFINPKTFYRGWHYHFFKNGERLYRWKNMLKFHEWTYSKAVLVIFFTHRNKFTKDQFQVFNEPATWVFQIWVLKWGSKLKSEVLKLSLILWYKDSTFYNLRL